MNEWERGNDRQFAPGYTQGYPAGYPQDAQANLPKKKKWLAGLLAFFIPGTGHLYLGLMTRGIVMMLLMAFDICAITFAAEQIRQPLVVLLLSLMLAIMYFYSLFDAVQSADVVNQRLLRYPAWPPSAFAHPHNYAAPYPPAAPSPAPGYGEGPSSQADPSAYTSAHAAAGAQESVQSASNIAGSMPAPPQRPANLPRQVNATGIMVMAAVAIVLVLVTGMGWSGWVFRSSGSMAGAVLLIGAGVGLWIWEMRGDRARKR